MQTIHSPQDEKRSHYAKVQEATRKDVERCFGVLQARFAIIANPCRQWDTNTMQDIMQACIILHNMIVENESGEEGLELYFKINSKYKLEEVYPSNLLLLELKS